MDADDIERLQHAADDGHLESMYHLGICYAQGKQLDQDDRLAAKWFHSAAKKGHAKAKTGLGYLYATGRGVRKDFVLAYVFLSQSSRSGDPQASDLLFRLRAKMHESQIKDADKRLRDSVTA